MGVAGLSTARGFPISSWWDNTSHKSHLVGHSPCRGDAVVNTASYTVVVRAEIGVILSPQKHVALWKALILSSAFFLDFICSLPALLMFFTAEKQPTPCSSPVLCGMAGTGPQLGHRSRAPRSSERSIRWSIKEECVLTAAQHYQQ